MTSKLMSYRKASGSNAFNRSAQAARDDVDACGSLDEAARLVEMLPFPVGLWTYNRDSCLFNASTRKLFGYSESDFLRKRGLWSDCLFPQDRDGFLTAWRKIGGGENSTSCQYRFLPRQQNEYIRVLELMFSRSTKNDSLAVWSMYSDDHCAEAETLEGQRTRRDLVRSLTHEIGNSLQVIGGEVDLLRLTGAMPQQSASNFRRGFEQIRELVSDVSEYLSPSPLEGRWEDTAAVILEVIQNMTPRLEDNGIRVKVRFAEALPRLPLGVQFRNALKRICGFSYALLQEGGELRVEAGLKRIQKSHYVEVRVVNESPTRLDVNDKDVFRPYLKVNDYCVGLTMSLARQILRNHFGKIIFRKEKRNRGVFSILIKIPSGIQAQ